MNIPKNLKYSSEHEWIKIDGKIVTIGITDFAQNELGDIVFVEFPEVGDKFENSDVFGTIEAVKTVADLFAPISGEITNVNTSLEDTPEAINNDPYGDGWVIKLKLRDISELDDLLDAKAYKEHLG